MPKRIHQTVSCDSPPSPIEANGGPLSLRITAGRPLPKRGHKHRLHLRVGRLMETLTAQQIPAGEPESVKGAIRVPSCPEPPFEVGGPHIVGLLDGLQGLRRRWRPVPPASRSHHNP
jgi:hypothetical protein